MNLKQQKFWEWTQEEIDVGFITAESLTGWIISDLINHLIRMKGVLCPQSGDFKSIAKRHKMSVKDLVLFFNLYKAHCQTMFKFYKNENYIIHFYA